MIYLKAIAVVSLFSVVNGRFTTPDEMKTRDLEWGDMTYVGPAFKDGPNVTITAATGQEIFQKLKEINPDYPWITREQILEAAEAENKLAKRDTKPPSGVYCGGRWGYCSIPSYDQAVQGIPTTGSAFNDPHKCGRVGCAYNCGIGWCNDNNVRKEVYWSDLHIRWDYTRYDCYNGNTGDVAGQTFYPDNTNAIVHEDRC